MTNDAVAREDGVGLRRGRAVGALGHDVRLDPRSVSRGDLVLESGGDEYVDVGVEQLVVVDRLRPGEVRTTVPSRRTR